MDISEEVIDKARALMQERTRLNGAPSWGLTELAIAQGKELAQEYGVDVSLITTALYLAHVVFSTDRNSEAMKKHMILSAKEAEEKLSEWGVAPDLISKIRKAIELHHTVGDSGDLFCEVMKNAECSKFLTVEGIKIFITDLTWQRDMTPEEAREYARYKMQQKLSYLTLDKVRRAADAQIPAIEALLSEAISS